jgi:hypothetical protein
MLLQDVSFFTKNGPKQLLLLNRLIGLFHRSRRETLGNGFKSVRQLHCMYNENCENYVHARARMQAMQSIKFFYCLICHCAVFMCKHVLYVSSIDLSFNARCGYSTTCMHVYIYVYVLPSVYIGWIRTCVHI